MSLPDKLHMPVDHYFALKKLVQWLDDTPGWLDLPESLHDRVHNFTLAKLETCREWKDLTQEQQNLLYTVELRGSTLHAIPDGSLNDGKPIPIFCCELQGGTRAEDC
jgi:hypothetical protein